MLLLPYHTLPIYLYDRAYLPSDLLYLTLESLNGGSESTLAVVYY